MLRAGAEQADEPVEDIGLRVVRTISHEIAFAGTPVTVTYDVTNTGDTDISNLRVREKISRVPKTLRNLAIGATTRVTFTAMMSNADLTSGAEITFRREGSASASLQIEDRVIPLAVSGLSVELSVDQPEVKIGQPVRLIMTE